MYVSCKFDIWCKGIIFCLFVVFLFSFMKILFNCLLRLIECWLVVYKKILWIEDKNFDCEFNFGINLFYGYLFLIWY